MFTLLYVLARLRRPVRLLECPHWASLLRPGGLPQARTASCGRGRRRFQASFRRVRTCTFWRLGFRQSSFRHIARVSRRAAPDAWARPPVCCHAIFPYSFRTPGKPSDPGIISSHPCPLRGRYSSAPRGALTQFSTFPVHPGVLRRHARGGLPLARSAVSSIASPGPIPSPGRPAGLLRQAGQQPRGPPTATCSCPAGPASGPAPRDRPFRQLPAVRPRPPRQRPD